jgi:hypothetical protein
MPKTITPKLATPAEIIRVAKLFEFYVKKIWPYHRFFAKNKISKRCKNCVASEKMIPLNADGICEKCVNYKASQNRHNTKIENELNQILNKSQGQGPKDYDALVLYSGGKDSTYLIRRIQTEFPKLRLLAYTLDNGFMSPIALQNIKDMVPRLKIDHVFIRPPENFHKNLFRFAITHLNAEGGYGTVDFSDGEFMLDTARKLAAEKNIPLILCGYSKYQVQNGLKFNSYESPREIELSDRTATAGLLLNDIFQSEAEKNLWWQGTKVEKQFVARLLFPLYAWDLEETEIKNKVKEWGLMNAKNHSPIVTNHLLIPLLGVVDVHRMGYSSFEVEFCRMIREGKADKHEWLPIFEFLEYTSKTGLFLKKTIIQSLQSLDLTLNDVGVKFA